MATAVAKIIYRCEKVSIISATLQYSTYTKAGEKEWFLLIIFAEGV